MTITPREFDFQAARRRLEAKTKSAGDKLTSLDVAVARVKDGDHVALGGCLFSRTPLGLVFIDGGHSQAAAEADYAGWSPHVAPGGLLAIHDVFPNPADGGRPPFLIYERALAEGWCEVGATGSLRVLRRRSPAPARGGRGRT